MTLIRERYLSSMLTFNKVILAFTSHNLQGMRFFEYCWRRLKFSGMLCYGNLSIVTSLKHQYHTYLPADMVLTYQNI